MGKMGLAITPPENIYGHGKRLQWIISHISKQDVIVEFGCGTGYMITRPLLKLGYPITGVDIDEASIGLGREIFSREGLPDDSLQLIDFTALDFTPDVIIASEVFEHLDSEELEQVLRMMHQKLKPGGRLLVTVPNGYGWFEWENFLWTQLGLGKLLEWSQINRIIAKLKEWIIGCNPEMPYPSTLSNSPHKQRFRYHTIQKIIQAHGFQVMDIRGSVLVAGLFSNLLWTGLQLIMKLNCRFGDWFPKFASGFYLECQSTRRRSL
jgi:SAM-dependent methyltransferase